MNSPERSFNRIICFLSALMIYFFMAAGNITQAESEGRRWAVIVGIDEYANEITPLRCAVNDAERLKDALIEKARFDEKNIFLLTSRETGNLKPTRANIVKRIERIKAEAKADDTFLFFFSGHGIDMEKKSYLLTCDAGLQRW